MKNTSQFDLIVVGSGALGAFHAYFALQKGLKVLLLEKDSRPVEATVRNFGQIIPSGMSEDEWFEYGKASVETYQAIQAQCDISIRQNGATYLASSDMEMQVLEEKHARYQALGYPSQVLTSAQCQNRIASLKADYCAGGLLFPQEITAEPAIMIYRLLAYMVEELGLDYRPSTPVIACTSTNAWCEVADSFGRRFTAPKVLVCNGRDFKFLFPALFFTSDLQICKLQMLSTAPLPQLKLPGSILTGLSIRRYYAFKNCPSYSLLHPEEVDAELRQWGIHILFKQAVDGSIIIGDSHQYADAAQAEVLDFGVDDRVNELILNEAKRVLNLPDWRIARSWNGFYAQSKSREIFEHTIDGKIHIVTGIGGKGMTTACGFAQQNVEKLGLSRF
ncbi:MAG: TIGR03364 family FAD-dependent oxidoreductase [Bacteroidota bacterium]